MKHQESSEIHENAFTGGPNECIEEIKRLAAEQDVPVFYVMNRWNIGKSILRKVPVSIVGVMNYDGTDVSTGSATRTDRRLARKTLWQLRRA